MSAIDPLDTGSLFATVFHHAPIGMALVGLDGLFLNVNPALCRIVGYSQEELQALSFLDITHPDDLYGDIVHTDRLIAGQSDAYQMDKRYVHKDGHEVWVRLHVSTVRDTNRQPIYFIAQIEDISGSRSQFEELRHLHEHHQLILDTVGEGIIGLDRLGRTTFLNRAGASILGFTAKQLVGRSFSDFILPGIPGERPDSPVVCAVELTLQDGQSRFVAEDWCARKDGTVLPVEYTITPTIQDGTITGVVILFRDRSEKLHTEELLREHDSLFKLINEHSQDVLTYTTPDGVCQYISPAVRELLGYEPEELIGTVLNRLYHPDDRNELMAFAFDQVGICTYRVKHKDGRYLWFESIFKMVFDNDGAIEKIVGIARDVHARIEAERKLVETREELANILHMQQGVIFKFKEINGRFVYTMADGMLLERLGEKPTDIIGQNPETIRQAAGNPEILNYYNRAWQGETVWYESRFNGITYLIALQPLQKDGKIVEVLGSGVDISERKKAEVVLLESEKRYRLLVENSTETIAIVQDERWVYLNDSGLALFRASEKRELYGTLVEERLPDARRRSFVAKIKQATETGMPMPPIPVQWLSLDGTPVHTEVLGIPIGYEGVPSLQLLIRDVTERKRNEEWMLQTEKLSAAGQLAAGIAHEIRNPLTAIKGFFKLMQTQGAKDQYFEIVDEEFRRIETIISELLVLAKPKEAAVVRCCLQELLGHVVSLLGTQAILSNITIIEDWPAEPILIQADEDQIKQVFINLVKNAIEVMPQGGEIRVCVTLCGPRVHIRVIDQGTGIPADKLEQIGQPFFSLKENGTGLGLSITFRIIEQHGGSIHFNSAENVGTTVEVILPIHP